MKLTKHALIQGSIQCHIQFFLHGRRTLRVFNMSCVPLPLTLHGCLGLNSVLERFIILAPSLLAVSTQLSFGDMFRLSPSGIWGASETSATAEALNSIRADCRKAGLYVSSSRPVPHLGSCGGLRGRAGGTAIISSWPIQPYPAPLPEEVDRSSRLCDGICKLGFGQSIYVAVLYGPTTHKSHENPVALLHVVMQTAVRRAIAFKGPALIMGDMNVDLAELPHWDVLQVNGWHDLAQRHCDLFGGMPDMTSWNSNGVARQTLLLANTSLTTSMTECRTTKLHTFNAHPVLEASFDLDTLSRHKIIWSLPRDSRELLVDPDRFRVCSDDVCAQQGRRFTKARDRRDPEEMLLAFCSAFEKGLRASTVSTDGEPAHLPGPSLGGARSRSSGR